MTEAVAGVTAQDVRDAIFPKPPFGKRGYDQKSVNDFLQLVARRLDGRGHLAAGDVRAIKFPAPRIFKRGHDSDAVDDLLERIAVTIESMGTA